MASMWREVAAVAQGETSEADIIAILRIWTAVTASLVQTVTTWRGGRQEVILLTQVMAQTAREAAVMAAMLGQQGDGNEEAV
jgi:hypothetical protein